jgi:hypothetical protein
MAQCRSVLTRRGSSKSEPRAEEVYATILSQPVAATLPKTPALSEAAPRAQGLESLPGRRPSKAGGLRRLRGLRSSLCNTMTLANPPGIISGA